MTFQGKVEVALYRAQDAVESTGETVNDAAGNLIDAVKKQWDDNGNLIVGGLIVILFLCLIGKIFKKWYVDILVLTRE